MFSLSKPAGYGLSMFVLSGIYVAATEGNLLLGLVAAGLLGAGAAGLAWKLIGLGVIPKGDRFDGNDILRLLALGGIFWILDAVGSLF